MGGVVQISAAEAKKKFGELLGRVAYGGETIVITRRGRPVARLSPVQESQRGRHLADVQGWLEDDDPFFTDIQAIVRSRSKEKLRTVKR